MPFVSRCVHFGGGPRCLGVSRRSVVSACGFRPRWGLRQAGRSSWKAFILRASPEKAFSGKEVRRRGPTYAGTVISR